MEAHTLSGGFADGPVQTAVAFREIMEAMARPGTIRAVEGAAPPAPVSVAAGVVILTLCDADTPIHLAGAYDCKPLREWIAFHTGAPVVAPDRAVFALGRWSDLALDIYPIGTPEYPDRSATMIVESDRLKSEGASLSGPGIKTEVALNLPERAFFQANCARYPLGLDFIFTAGAQMAALPRTTKVR